MWKKFYVAEGKNLLTKVTKENTIMERNANR